MYTCTQDALDLTIQVRETSLALPRVGTPTGHIQTCTGTLTPLPQTCSNLFNVKHVRLASGRLAFYWNAFLFWVVSIPSMDS